MLDQTPELDYLDGLAVEWHVDPYDEHRAFHYSTESEWHAAWHRENRVPIGQPGCPQDACDDDGQPAWRGASFDSPGYCDHRGPCGPGCPDGFPPF